MSLNNYASLALTFFEVNLFSSFFKTDRTNQPTNQRPILPRAGLCY
jgi:hypothetical protein